MALNFPSSPVLGQVFTSGTRSWRLDGTGWVAVRTGGGGPWKRARNERLGIKPEPRRGMSPRARIECWHLALGLAVLLALAGISLSVYLDLKN